MVRVNYVLRCYEYVLVRKPSARARPPPRLVGRLARLCSSAGYAVAQGACARLACIECLRAVPPDVAGAAAVCDGFRRATGLHVDAQYAAVLSMERLMLKATGHHGRMRTGLTSREFDVREVERDVLRFVRDDACNAMQLQLVSLIDDGARDEEEEAQGGEDAAGFRCLGWAVGKTHRRVNTS